MTVEPRPLLTFNPAISQKRPKRGSSNLPRPSKLSPERQRERLSPQFRALTSAFKAERARLQSELPDEVDPALVVVFDLAGGIADFCNAINKIDGMEFLTELIGEQTEADDDFYMMSSKTDKTDKPVNHSLYLVMSNARAIDELLRLFDNWQFDPTASFQHGLGKFKDAFQQLAAIRRWGPEDRIRETGLREKWKEDLEIVGQAYSPVLVEVELWYRADPAQRAHAEETVKNIIAASNGQVISRAVITAIGYHAILAELPIQQVESVLNKGAESIQLLTTDAVMFVSPFTPMSVEPYSVDSVTSVNLPAIPERIQGQPRIALLDGLPLQNHDALKGRLLIDDPDDLGSQYPLTTRQHGTAMASLIIHGDLSQPSSPLDRPLYVRPIMKPQEFIPGELIVPDRLFPDLLHSAIKRIVEGEGNHAAAAPSVRIINLSIGAESRALSRRISPIGRLLDWLAKQYNLLFIVSAGNHTSEITISAEDASDPKSACLAAQKAVFQQSLVKGILPPGDAINVLTIGATHSDAAGDISIPDAVWDVTYPDGPAHYSATGPGVGRSIKPDLLHSGGRALYLQPVDVTNNASVNLKIAHTLATGPGLQVASPDRSGSTNNTSFTFGTSNAAALVSREASQLFDVLELAESAAGNLPLLDPQFHPLLVRALLVHASSWDDWKEHLQTSLGLSGNDTRRKLTALLGYGHLDLQRLGTASTNRAVLLAGGFIGCDERQTYELPLPSSLRSKAEWHRFTVTLAYAAPTVSHLNRYRGAKVYFEIPDEKVSAAKPSEADHHAVRRGSLQHEIVEGSRAMTFMDGDVFPIHIECMKDAQSLRKEEKIRYGLVVSIETAERTSNTIHQEVQTALRAQIRERTRGRAR